MPMDLDPIIPFFFKVELDNGLDLGNWTEVNLGGMSLQVDKQEEGGNALFPHLLPGKLTYDNIRLTRQLTPDSIKISIWFNSLAQGVLPATASITGFGRDGKKLVQWSFANVMPVKWTLPSFGIDQNKVATESLELAHAGIIATP